MEFQKFNKIPRLSRDCIITEKIDGTNAQIFITSFTDDIATDHTEFVQKHCLYEKNGLFIFAGSRRKWLDISSKGDNFGFAKWVQANAEELIKLGEGRHYGEWWGKGIQRGYNIDEKVFSLFNVSKWNDPEVRPKCCRVVPILYEGIFDTDAVTDFIEGLRANGSHCVPGYMNPEGIIIYHTASNSLFKKTVINDEKPKELIKNESSSRT